jgi:hypothetical protein
MKVSPLAPLLFAALSCLLSADSARAQTFTNFIRQTQYPTEVVWDATVAASGTQQSALAVDPGGARFELWTVKSAPLTSYLLDTKYVGSYVPLAWTFVFTEDPYDSIPRTRADRPFWIYTFVSGLLSGATDPLPSKSVNFTRHVQAYGAGGTGIGINRSLATLHTQGSINVNGWQTLYYALNSIPGADRAKVRGEERFTISSLADYQAPASQLASLYVQIWPVASGFFSGLSSGMIIKGAMPTITATINDIYPDSRIFAKVYPGASDLAATGDIVGGSALIIYDSVPQSRTLSLNDWDGVLTGDGQWTVDLMSTTPFGTERLDSVTFTLDRAIKVKGSVTTID